jgi:VWFA-related protein
MFHPQRESVRRPVNSCVYCFLLLISGLAALSFSSPQQEQNKQTTVRQKTPTFSVESAMVVVDVTVRDRKGNLMDDLRKEDFRIYEDNVLQDIVTFSAEKVAIGPSPEPAMTEANGKAKPTHPLEVVNFSLNPNAPVKKETLAGKRLIILFFDLSSLGTEDLIRSVDAARDFVAEQSGPQDLIAIATYSSILSLVQDFTNDRDLLLNILNSLSSSETTETTTEDLSDSSASEDVFVPDTVQFNIFNTDRRLSALETLAKTYREFPERKSLIYFSSGVTTTGIENNAQIRSTVDNANRSNMSIYTVDCRGLVALPPGGDASQASAGGAMFRGAAMMRQRNNFSSSQETLTTVSHDTGGRTFTDSNDLSLALNQVQSDTNIYYVLGYFSTNPKEDGRYRKIRVEVTGPGLKIEHRPGYFAAKAFNQMNQEERDLQLHQAMNVDRPFVDVPLILEVDYFRKDNNTAFVPISMELAGNGLMFEEKGSNREGKFEFVAQAADGKGKIAAVARDAVQLKMPAEKADRIKEGGVFYSTGFQLREGDYTLKFLVRDNVTGKLGSFEQPFRVPAFDLKKLAVSSIVLGNQLASLLGDSNSYVSHEGAMRRFQRMNFGYDPLVMGNRKVVPSIGNVFLAQQTVYVYFQVYGARADHETQKPCIETDLILLRDNQKILETQPQYVEQWTSERFGPRFGRGEGPAKIMPGSGGRGGFGGPTGMPGNDERKGESTVAVSLPLKNLKKGTYTLQIHVHDAIADVNLFRRLPIVIQ